MERSRNLSAPNEKGRPIKPTCIVFALLASAASSCFSWSSRSDVPLFEEVHQIAIERVLKIALSSDAHIALLQEEQVVVDKDQDVPQSFEHAMTGVLKKQNHAVQLPLYIAQSNQFVAIHLGNAIRLRKAGDIDNALHELGKALHPLEDATSPAHEGFQPWSEGESAWKKAKHVLSENAYPSGADGTKSDKQRRYLEGVVAWAYDIYIGAVAFPPEFFDGTGQLLLPPQYLRP